MSEVEKVVLVSYDLFLNQDDVANLEFYLQSMRGYVGEDGERPFRNMTFEKAVEEVLSLGCMNHFRRNLDYLNQNFRRARGAANPYDV